MLNIARTIYAGYDPSSAKKYELPEVEVIPLGESTNEKKKLASITKRYAAIQEHDNIPLPGFTLYITDRKNWGSIDQTWLIIDPRGFLVRISSKNLENILHVTGITEGLIQQKCVWARENTETKMTLVPVSSSHYVDAVENTVLIESKVDMKDVQIGDTVLLQNKLQGIYRGVASLYGPLNDYSTLNEYKPQTFLRRQILEVDPGKYYYQADLKILKIVTKASIISTRKESVSGMNSHILSAKAYFSNTASMSGTYYGTRHRIKLASIHAVPKASMTFIEITKTEAGALYYSGSADSDFGQLLLEDSKGDKFLVDYPYIYSGQPHTTIDNFSVIKVMPFDLTGTEKIALTEKRKSFWGPTTAGFPTFSLDYFTKFYKIVKSVKDQTYN